MHVEVRPEIKQFVRTLVPIKGVDLGKPWKEIVPQINLQLQQLRYKEFKQEKPIQVLIGNLDNASPEKPDSFDPVIINYIYDNDETPQEVRAVAKLGLQAIYWEGLSKAASPSNREHFPYERWQEFAVQPVFLKGKRYYLKPNDIRPNVFSNIHYAGDRDMIEYAKSRVMSSGDLNVPFPTLGITGALLDQYIILREKIHRCEDNAQKDALLSYREERPEIWSYLKRIYPNIDEVVDGTENFTYGYLVFAGKLVKDSMGLTGQDVPPAISNLISAISYELGFFLHFQTRNFFGIKLFRDRDFYSSLKGLGKLTRQIYEASLNSLGNP